jgi:hypothetical protein
MIPPFLSRSVGEEGGLGGKVRAALTPSPSPAVRELGGHGLGIVDRRGHRIATATLTPRFHSLSGGGRGPGEGVGHNPPFLSRSVGEEGGLGGEGEGHQACSTAQALNMAMSWSRLIKSLGF